MKTNILRISVLPLLVLGLLLYSYQPENKGKGKNDQESSRNGNKDDRKSKGNKGSDDRNRDYQPPKSNKDQKGDNKDKNHDNKGNKNYSNDNERGKDKADQHKENNGKDRFDDKRGKSHREVISLWDGRNIDWGVKDFANRKRPKDFKKVSLCHQTGNDGYPVSINVSENAVQAHLNHGDQIGSCTVRYSDRWTSGYINAREEVYTNYENTWETMSYSESLLAYAMDKLLGVRSSLNVNRATYTSSELQRKEALINDLQQNVNALQSQLNATEQRMNGVNITIQL